MNWLPEVALDARHGLERGRRQSKGMIKGKAAGLGLDWTDFKLVI